MRRRHRAPRPSLQLLVIAIVHLGRVTHRASRDEILYASYTNKSGENIALVGKYENQYKAEQTKDIEMQAWSDEGLVFTLATVPLASNISYEKLQEMVMK